MNYFTAAQRGGELTWVQLPYKYLVAAAFIGGLFIDILDATIVNVALPTIGRELQAGNDTLEWVVTGYLLSLAVWIPASGWIRGGPCSRT